MEPAKTLDEVKAIVALKPFPRVTEESIKAKITMVTYDRPRDPAGQELGLTVCTIAMQNGFFVVGITAPADPRNYDRDVGERYAYENAFKQLWQLEGYLLREKLSGMWSEPEPPPAMAA